MTFAPRASYQSRPHPITIHIDTEDPKDVALEKALIKSFGEKYARSENLGPPRYRSLHLLPGGALELPDKGQQKARA